ncbi:uncharacterized protein LOC133177166 [Saccostrea echinata]|uniref:uncharacterized protein LOC133177166 n=1 Tax=Saccostrea echinata TaxID=191078 RepID=UPI002A7FFB7D|nr:uncharacterized protein LOC133177166 [Saccostrea echinata]
MNSNAESIRSWLNEDDIFIVDRGFRDALPLLADLGIQAEMPFFLEAGQKQMSTEDANMSRLVTKVRWVVESSNARIKRWRYLDRTLPTHQIPFIGDYIRIVCAVSNRFSHPLSSSSSREEDDAEAAKMLHLSKQVNHLKAFIEEKGLQRKTAVWKPTSEVDLDSFPIFDVEELRNLTCGTYQLKLSSSYMQEHMDGESDIYFHEEDNTLLRAKIQSRHTSSKKYQLWIRYSESTVESWYCTCRTGAQVVGMCSHIAAVAWYLSGARHREKSFGVRDWSRNVLDAANIPPVIDDSDSESGGSLPEE